MLTEERREKLMAELRRSGRLVARQISQDWDLSEDTIRRDLRALAAARMLKRVHGGAVSLSPAVGDLEARRPISSPEKRAIGAAAAAMIAPRQVVFVDGGTTALALARALDPDLTATVVTHSPEVALALAAAPGLTVEIIGGRFFRHSGVACGAVALAGLAALRFDLCFVGVTGAEAEAGLTTKDRDEAALKHRVLQNSGEGIVMASPEKIGAVSSFAVAGWRDVSRLLVARPEPDLARAIAPSGCEVCVA